MRALGGGGGGGNDDDVFAGQMTRWRVAGARVLVCAGRAVRHEHGRRPPPETPTGFRLPCRSRKLRIMKEKGQGILWLKPGRRLSMKMTVL
jgi:hypothetical protein